MCLSNSEKPGDDKLLQRPIKIMERMEASIFVPEEDSYCCESKEALMTGAGEVGRMYHGCDSCLRQPFERAFTTKDSGERKEFSTGMVRDVSTDKPRYDLIWLPGIKRVAELMSRGAAKYSARNWEKASTQEEMDRFKESALRHMYQWLEGDRTEDHMAAVVFNLFGAEFVREKLK